MLANSKKNRNIKPNDVNLISAASGTDFYFKTMYVGMLLCFRSIVRCFQCFVRGPSPFGKQFLMNPPLALGNYCLWTPPPPRNFQSSSGGVWIHLPWGGGGYGYFLEPHSINYLTMKCCLMYQNHVDFKYQTTLCALRHCCFGMRKSMQIEPYMPRRVKEYFYPLI